MRNKFRLIVLIMVFILSLGLIGCEKCSNTPDNVKDTETKNQIVLKYKEVQMKLYSDFEFICYSGVALQYSVADNNIASIDENGFIKSYSLGETTISVTDGVSTETAKLVVYHNDDIPYVQTDVTDEFNLSIGDKILLSPKLYYSGQQKEAVFAVSSDNDSVVKVTEQGEILAVENGQAKILIVTEFYKQLVEKVVVVNVVSDVSIETPANGYTLFAYDNSSSITLPTDVLVDEQKLTNALVYEYDDKILSYDGNGCFSLKRPIDGSENTVIKAVYERSLGETHIFSLPISIVYKDVLVDEKVQLENNKKEYIQGHKLQFDEQCGTGETIKILEEGKDLGFDALSKEFAIEQENGVKIWKVYNTDGCIYTLTVEIVDLILRNADDIDNVLAKATKETIILVDDIYYNDNPFSVDAREYNSVGVSKESKFEGTLDGQGHFIYGLKMSKSNYGGMFYSLQVKGVVKNISFANTVLNTTSYANFVIARDIYGTVENVYISAKIDSRNTSFGLLSYYLRGGSAVLNNIVAVIEYEGSATKNGSLTYMAVDVTKCQNVYVLSNLEKLNWCYFGGKVDGVEVYPEEEIVSEHILGVTKINDKEELLDLAREGKFAQFINEQIIDEMPTTIDITSNTDVLVERAKNASFVFSLPDGGTITKVKMGAANLSYSNGTINGEILYSGKNCVTVYSNKGNVYLVTVTGAEIVIDSAEEFVSVMGAISVGSTDYIALANDIVFNGTETYKRANRFCGTLDGRGYTVDGLDLTKHGLTNSNYAMINGGNFTMKNIAFVNVNMATVNGTRVHLCGNTTWGITIENCYLELDGGSTGLAWSHTDTFTIKDTIIVRNTSSTVNALFNAKNNATSKIVGEDFYLVSNDNALLYGGYTENDGYFTGSVVRNSNKATILSAINESQTASAQLKAFANEYLK